MTHHPNVSLTEIVFAAAISLGATGCVEPLEGPLLEAGNLTCTGGSATRYFHIVGFYGSVPLAIDDTHPAVLTLVEETPGTLGMSSSVPATDYWFSLSNLTGVSIGEYPVTKHGNDDGIHMTLEPSGAGTGRVSLNSVGGTIAFAVFNDSEVVADFDVSLALHDNRFRGCFSLEVALSIP